MGEISDIVSSIKELGHATSDLVNNISFATSKIVRPSSRSVSAMALQGIANFSVLMSDSVDFEDGIMIGTSLEQRFATFLLTVLTMNPYMSVSGKEGPSAAEYLKQFHQNMGTQYEMDTKEISKMFESGIPNFDTVSENMTSFITDASDTMGIDYNCWVRESLQIASVIYEGVSSNIVNMQNMKFNYTMEDVTERVILNDKGVVKITSALEASVHGYQPKKIKQWNDKKSKVDPIVNNEFKKSNDSVPTLLHIRVYPYDKDTKQSLEPMDFVVGVKATIHQVSSTDIISNLASGLHNGGTFFNFIRWTTGETKFFKDFLLMMDQNKFDAANLGSSANGWWSALRRRKASSTIRKFSKGKGILPNATIVCTTDDLIALKETHGFDLTGPNTELIYTLMKKYFLISFVRVNPALQRVDFLFDGNSQFETSSYATISKQNGKDDKKFKEMMKMLGRSA